MSRPGYMTIVPVLLCWVSCLGPEDKPLRVSITQDAGCRPDSVAACPDSLFSSTVGFQMLRLRFLVTSACSPDTDRFSFSWSLDGDTISIDVTDTAGGDGTCTCPYAVTAEFNNLELHDFTVKIRDTKADSLLHYRLIDVPE